MRVQEQAVLAHIQARPWADHPRAKNRRRRASVADLLRLSSGEALAAARRLAREQRARGVKTIDTSTLSGSLGRW